MDGNADLYETLQVSPNAESEVIEAAYRRLARKYHPDAGLDASQDRMAEINGAYETLSDRAKRAAYDRRRAANRATPSAVRANRGPRRPVATAETAPPARSAPAAPTAPAVNVSRITIACRRCRGAAFRQGKPIGWPRGENFRQGSTLRCTDCGRHWRYAWTIDHPNVLDPEHERYSPKAGGVIRPSRNLLRFTAAVIFLFALAIVAAIVLFPDPTVRLIGDLERIVVELVQRVKS